MKTLTLRLDEIVYKQIACLAEQERRSLNSQILYMLELSEKYWGEIVQKDLKERNENMQRMS